MANSNISREEINAHITEAVAYLADEAESEVAGTITTTINHDVRERDTIGGHDQYRILNGTDGSGRPAGGFALARGVVISWQDGPLGRDPEERARNRNGAFVETVLEMAVSRLEFYQTVGDGRFACEENERAIDRVYQAIAALNERTARRERAGTEGTHDGS